ncbi:MAG: rRNA maturation RNase YbeY [bacterium]|nr:rRNA maturation RNase YbeY [bacterium]
MRELHSTFSIAKTTKGKLPRLPFQALKNEVLGPHYDLSLVFIGRTRSRSLNRRYRGKDRPTDVLSFPIDKHTGEIFISPEQAKITARKFGYSKSQKFLAFLFIHGLFHLKGYEHGSTMENEELKVRKKFGI